MKKKQLSGIEKIPGFQYIWQQTELTEEDMQISSNREDLFMKIQPIHQVPSREHLKPERFA
jgi:hypothetical protein